jgi:hypothetical protein
MSQPRRQVDNIARLRLEHQHLVSPTFSDPVEVVRALGAVQSQDYAGAKWALAQRARGLAEPHIERAIASGAILRTHVLRPTWHFVLPEDARWMLALTAPRVAAAMGFYNRYNELDERLFRRSNKALERALRDGAQLTRAELTAVLRRSGVNVSTRQRVVGILLQAELDRVVISGGRRGAQFTYASFDLRVPAAAERDRDDALQELARRYFATRGPATLQDFAWWSGLTVADAKRGIEAAGDFLARETHADRAYWYEPSARVARGALRRSRVAHLLPNYDEFFVGFRDRSAFSERLRRAAPNHPVNALMGHILCIDGQIVGGWRRTLGKHVNVELRLLVTLTPTERILVQRAVARFGEFLGAPARIQKQRSGR